MCREAQRAYATQRPPTETQNTCASCGLICGCRGFLHTYIHTSAKGCSTNQTLRIHAGRPTRIIGCLACRSRDVRLQCETRCPAPACRGEGSALPHCHTATLTLPDCHTAKLPHYYATKFFYDCTTTLLHNFTTPLLHYDYTITTLLLHYHYTRTTLLLH